MPVISRVTDETVIIEVSGRVTIGIGDVLVRDAIQEAVQQGHRQIVVDLAGVRALDSSGVGELVAAHKLLRSLDGRLVLTRLSSRVGGVLAATRLSGILEIEGSIEGALLSIAA